MFGLIEGQLVVLLGRREQPPDKGRWALPGGVLRIDLDADLEAAAQRIAQERLGTKLPYLRQQIAVGGRGRDPRSPWALSIVFRALVQPATLAAHPGKRLDELRWAAADQAAADESLALGHHALVESAVAQLRMEVERLDLPFGFLPETFTLGELQRDCEAILGRPLDKSSFRRRLADRECVEPVPGAFRQGANRPAQVYRANAGAVSLRPQPGLAPDP